MGVDRRKVLAGFAAASAVGVTATAADGLVVNGVSDDATESPHSGLVVTAVNLRLSSTGKEFLGPGERALLSAELAIEGSDVVGSLHGVYLVIGSPGMVGVAAPTSIENHYFVFPNGTLVGTGTASLDDSPDDFVVVGGTGVFAGASGSYAAVQRPLGVGGDGTATYRFAIAT